MTDRDDSLQHYASPYYDPVKAHEYYMKNRELKGRRSTSKLSDEGKKVWSYTKSQITSEKKGKVESETQKKDSKVEVLRTHAQGTRKRIAAKLKTLNEKLSNKSKDKRKAISDRKESEIEKLMGQEIPKGISKEKRAELIAERNEKIAKLRSDAKSDSDSVTEDAKKERQSNSAEASQKREKVATELKSAIEATRAAYKEAKSSINESYEEIYQREFDRILSEYAKPTKTKKSSSKKSSETTTRKTKFSAKAAKLPKEQIRKSKQT